MSERFNLAWFLVDDFADLYAEAWCAEAVTTDPELLGSIGDYLAELDAEVRDVVRFAWERFGPDADDGS